MWRLQDRGKLPNMLRLVSIAKYWKCERWIRKNEIFYKNKSQKHPYG